MEHPDIFDRIMSWKLFKPLFPFYSKYKEQLLYLFFGVLTTLVNLLVFWLLVNGAKTAPLAANVVAWIAAVAFAYVTNRTWVFAQKAHGRAGVVREAVSFAAGRLATLGMEELILWAGLELLGADALPVKFAAAVLVVIGNYVISKFFVFRKPAQ